MVDQSDIDVVESSEERYRFQFRDRAQFDALVETPEWAQKTAQTLSDGATVRMGTLSGSDALRVESVAIPRKPALGRAEAKNVAAEIVEELHS